MAPHVTGALTKSTVAVGEPTRFKGTVSPAADGQPVQLQRLKGDKWVTVATKHLTAGSSSDYSFKIRRGVSGRYRYRTFVPSYAGRPATAFDGPATGLALRVYRAEITAVHHVDDEFVKVANTGAVRIDLRWLAPGQPRTGMQRTLPEFVVRPGSIVRIHSGAGTSDRDDLYLGREDMWGKHATALLRNEQVGAAGPVALLSEAAALSSGNGASETRRGRGRGGDARRTVVSCTSALVTDGCTRAFEGNTDPLLHIEWHL